MSKVESDADQIRKLNDQLRRTHRGGKVLLTSGIASMDATIQATIVKAVAEFKQFTEDNDPHDEHDCAIFSVGDHRVMFKIDYYDLTLTNASEDPADPAKTARVMTVMLAREY